ncbi:TnsA endonuclease N-terminal domain-containing protein [Agarivorans sp. DSG3-1]|uniref:TnsA endonuclease N-terminal domain-containing protein n=1 Tax=Agarivorans sp. DSG3-1 TaxID=3342249 RepID=UPI00398F11F8
MSLSRQINKATTAKIARNSFSIKTGSMQYTESLNETDVCLALEFNPAVKAYTTQPDSFINTSGRGGWRRYTPDVLAEFYSDDNDDFRFLEIKPEVLTHSESFKQKFALHQRIVKEHSGLELELIVEPAVHPHTLTQWRQLKAYYRYETCKVFNQHVCQFISENGKAITLRELELFCQIEDVPDFYPLVMLAHQVLHCVHPEVITRETLIEVTA